MPPTTLNSEEPVKAGEAPRSFGEPHLLNG